MYYNGGATRPILETPRLEFYNFKKGLFYIFYINWTVHKTWDLLFLVTKSNDWTTGERKKRDEKHEILMTGKSFGHRHFQSPYETRLTQA